jgi:hypothetical protein
MSGFVTNCPECKGQLYLRSCCVSYTRGPIIHSDGFDLNDCSLADTSYEIVECEACGWFGDLEYEEET